MGANLDQSSAVQAVVDWFGPTDFTLMDKQRLPNGMVHDGAGSPESKYLGGPVQQKKELAAQANPITYITSKCPPFFIAHGDRDALVPFGQSEILMKALAAKKIQSAMMKVEGQGHGFHSQEATSRSVAFMKDHLMGK